MAANYNNSAWFYDSLSRMVYGKALVNAQVYLLQFVPSGSNILIVGGGTGWILEELTKLYPAGLRITYVEVSEKMTAISRRRNIEGNQVIFINEAIENAKVLTDFDVIITPFLFDNFTERTFHKVFVYIHQLLKPKGLWLNSDFQPTGKWWQVVLLRAMFLFFKVWCGIEATQLPEIGKHFEGNGYKPIAKKTFFGDFVVSTVYKI